MTVKERIHQILDDLTEDELLDARSYLEQVRAAREDPRFRRLLDAPWDDEPLTEEDLAAIAESRADVAAGRVVSNEEMRREFGW